MLITDNELKLLIDRVRKQYEGKVFCYVAVVHPNRNSPEQFMVGIAVLGEPGYSFPPVRSLHSTYAGAADMADRLNAFLPYSPDTVIAIVADTMRRSEWKREQESLTSFDRVYKVKVSFQSERAASIFEDEICECIEEYMDDEIAEHLGIAEVEARLG